MEIFKEEDIQPVQLECVLCPKRPSFSDVSHLLTHVSSKSHLHQKFNIEFKAKSEIGARERLQRYEEWYAIHGIETLLSERLATKNQKTTGRRGRSSTSSVSLRWQFFFRVALQYSWLFDGKLADLFKKKNHR